MASIAVGLTTCSTRLETTLPRTLESLAAGGFPTESIHLFVDDDGAPKPWALPPCARMTIRQPAARTTGNWACSLAELFFTQPDADWLLLFQDDLLLMENTRDLLEHALDQQQQCRDYYFNLYTSLDNESRLSGQHVGWHNSNQYGRGALALAFPRAAVPRMLHGILARFDEDPEHRWKGIDGMIAGSFPGHEKVHMPSLATHIGWESSIDNGRHPDNATFAPGDARKLRPGPVKTGKRIGLLGFNSNTGLGELNRQIARYADIAEWLIKPHPRGDAPLPEDIDTAVCLGGRQVEAFLHRIDVLLFCETAELWPNMQVVRMARALGKRIVCVPMWEWLDPAAQAEDLADLYISPTICCHESIRDVLPSRLWRWPISMPNRVKDTGAWPWETKSRLNRFGFLAGFGGVNARKGSAFIQSLVGEWPEIPLTIRQQTQTYGWSLKRDQTLETRNFSDIEELYSDIDCLLVPSKVDGLGLTCLEAAARGIPIISTDGDPWNEYPAIGKIEAACESRGFHRRYEPRAGALARVCRDLHGSDIAVASAGVRLLAGDRAWCSARGEELTELVLSGVLRRRLAFGPSPETPA